MTGCVNPAGMAFTKLQNPIVRRQHYVDAINFYIQNTDSPVLFVENSAEDLSMEFDTSLFSKRLEILTFDGNIYDKSWGKGFGEMMIIRYALDHSFFLSKYEYVIKITGRYKVLNIDSYLNNSNDFISVDVIKSLTLAESKLVICNKEFLKAFLIKYQDQLNDSKGYYFEHALLHACYDAIKKGFKYSTLVETPRFSGVFGSDNVKFNDSYLRWSLKNLKFKVKNYFINI